MKFNDLVKFVLEDSDLEDDNDGFGRRPSIYSKDTTLDKELKYRDEILKKGGIPCWFATGNNACHGLWTTVRMIDLNEYRHGPFGDGYRVWYEENVQPSDENILNMYKDGVGLSPGEQRPTEVPPELKFYLPPTFKKFKDLILQGNKVKFIEDDEYIKIFHKDDWAGIKKDIFLTLNAFTMWQYGEDEQLEW